MRRPALILVVTLCGVAAPAGRAQQVMAILEGSGGNSGHFGHAIADIPDLDGDGFRDLVITAPTASAGAGRVAVHSGKTRALLFSLIGGEAGAELGFSAAALEDVDLDGHPDLLLGAPWSNVASSASGRAEVVSGKDGAGLRSLPGSLADGYFGYAVTGVGDLNADGRGDALVGAPGVTSSARVISAIDGAVLKSFNGAVASATGAAVAGGRDATGDGVPDYLVTASTEAIFTPGAVGLGKARLYSGSNHLFVREYLPVVDSRFGDRALLSGDLDGDGRSEVVIGAGKVLSPSDVLMNRIEVFDGANGAHRFSIVGSQSPKSDVGFALTSIEDMTGDGRRDLLSGAPNHELVAGQARGRVAVYGGMTGGLAATITGESIGDQFGHGVAAIGDVNGDGVEDILVGAPLDDDAGFDAGRAFVCSVVDLPLPEVSIQLGDKLIGTTGLVAKTHRFLFTGLKGATMKLKVSGGSGPLIPRLVLKNDQDAVLQQWTLPISPIATKVSALLPHTGAFVLEIDGANSTLGGYTVKTNRKLPASAGDLKSKVKGATSYTFHFDALPGAVAGIKVKPVGGPDPFQIELTGPDANVIDVSGNTIVSASGKVTVGAVVLPTAGTYTLRLVGVGDSQKLFKVAVKLFQPKGAATHVVD